MRLPSLNYAKGFLRFWLVLTVPWLLFSALAFSSEIQRTIDARAELRSDGWCLPSEMTSTKSGLTQDEPWMDMLDADDRSAMRYFNHSWGWCRSDTPSIRLNDASMQSIGLPALLMSLPFLILAGWLVIWRVGRWVRDGFRRV